MELLCKCCGKTLPLDQCAVGFRRPGAWLKLTAAERVRARGKDSDDYVAFNEGSRRRYFVRAVLDLPIVGSDEVFSFGPWVELDEPTFLDYGEHTEDREAKHEWFGVVSIEPGHEIPDQLPVRVMQVVDQRPKLLARDEVVRTMQEQGISTERVHAILTRHLGWS